MTKHPRSSRTTCRDWRRVPLNAYFPMDGGVRASLSSSEVIDPRQFFVCTGDAIMKTKVLLSELRALALAYPPNQILKQFKITIASARRLLVDLLEIRGSHFYLETAWSDGELQVCPKDRAADSRRFIPRSWS